jgi:hypothetical protein
MMLARATSSRQRGFSQPGWTRVADCGSPLQSAERGQRLLRQWLSPEQAEQYDKYQRFEVVGCDTGTRYRILPGKIMNIVELAPNGHVKRRWCFAPEGALATGDVMLAQKIALETFELNALAIANHDGPQGGVFPSRSFLDIDELVWLVLAFACFATLVWSFLQIAF